MFKILKGLLKRKRYAHIYPVGGYPTPTDLRKRASSGECVINTKQQDVFTVHKRVMDALLELEAKEVAVTEEEVGEAVAKAIGERFRYLQEKIKHSTTNCPNCGAPMHNGKCEYCGTEYKQ